MTHVCGIQFVLVSLSAYVIVRWPKSCACRYVHVHARVCAGTGIKVLEGRPE